MSSSNKIKWILGILMIFVLIITTNLIDKNNFIRVKESVETIYNDRLIANDIIFEMLVNIQKKEIIYLSEITSDTQIENKEVNKNFQDLIIQYEATKLTLKENQIFNDLTSNFEKVMELENENMGVDLTSKTKITEEIIKMKENLSDLSKIQLREGSRQKFISKKAIDTIELFTQIEIYFLVFLAIAVQMIIMYTPKNNQS